MKFLRRRILRQMRCNHELWLPVFEYGEVVYRATTLQHNGLDHAKNPYSGSPRLPPAAKLFASDLLKRHPILECSNPASNSNNIVFFCLIEVAVVRTMQGMMDKFHSH